MGRCMNCEILLIAKDISRRVMDRYCRALTRLRYGEGSVRESPERSERACAVDIGVLTGLASNMLLFWRRSSLYRCWEIMRPSGVKVASIPRK
jgi:hypothetical protein